MRAVVCHGEGDVRVEEGSSTPRILDRRDPIVRVTKGAICGSDLRIFRGHFKLKQGDIVGHEFVGYVGEVGSGVKTLEKGDKVVGPFWISCGDCFYCRRGLTTSCVSGGAFGLGTYWVDTPGAGQNL
jgi:threonine dehydrogenase-like Zn-dependent dehydrogenase